MNELIQLLTENLINVVLIVLTTLGAVALNAVRDLLGISKDNELFKAFDAEIPKAINTAAHHLLDRGMKVDFNTRHEWLNEAGRVLAEQAPKLQKRTGFTPEEVAHRIEGFLYERLGQTTKPADGSAG